ncbi:MAG: hypothetical protein FJ315_02965 [SAR202 cluster bacterium]|nr:hypothetical protein [SAR202 cluster bacterium]
MNRFLLSIVGISALMIWLKVMAISVVNLMLGGPDGTPGWWLQMMVKEAQGFLGFVAAGALVLIPTMFIIMHAIALVRGFFARAVLPGSASATPAPPTVQNISGR